MEIYRRQNLNTYVKFNVNTDFDDPMFCKSSAGIIPIFDKSLGPLSVNIDCTDCFAAYEFDFVVRWHTTQQQSRAPLPSV